LHGAKALPLLAVQECGAFFDGLSARGGSRQRAEPAERRCTTALPRSVWWLSGARSALVVMSASCGVVGLNRSKAKPGDYLNVRLAGTPAGRFAAFT